MMTKQINAKRFPRVKIVEALPSPISCVAQFASPIFITCEEYDRIPRLLKPNARIKKAMSEYTDRDKKKYGDPDVDKVAYPKFQEKLEICQDLFHGFDYSKFFGDSNLERSKVISMGVNFMEDFSRENTKKDYLKEALLLKKWLSLCSSRAKERERFEAAFFEAVRTVLVKVSSTGKLSLLEINKQITELLNQSIKSTGVINVINVSKEVSLFDPEFLDKVRALESSNLTRSILEKLLDDEVKVYTKQILLRLKNFQNY